LYTKTSNFMKVTVKLSYNSELSSPLDHHYVWQYKVTIENNRNETVQLISRHWQIINSGGKLKEVIGEGVVGKQPILHPGNKFEYTSATDLDTPTGIMKGTYTILSDVGEFNIIIPTFSLDKPGTNSILN